MNNFDRKTIAKWLSYSPELMTVKEMELIIKAFPKPDIAIIGDNTPNPALARKKAHETAQRAIYEAVMNPEGRNA